MRLIGSLTDHKHAERFVAYLVTQGIQSHIEPEDEQFEIWIKDEDALDMLTFRLKKGTEGFKVVNLDVVLLKTMRVTYRPLQRGFRMLGRLPAERSLRPFAPTV